MNHLVSTRSRLRLLGAPALGLAAIATPPRPGALTMHQSTPASPVASPSASPVADATNWVTIADEMWDAIQSNFLAPEYGLYTEHLPVLGEDKAFSYLWPYTGVVSAANARYAIRGDEMAAADLRAALGNLEQYWDATSNPPGYDSYVIEFGGGDKFYDDNQWLGIDFVLAARALGDPTLLDKARAMWEFTLSGWDEEMDGGIYWKQYDPSTKNTCSNGPAAVLGAMLHEETGEQEYVDWVVRILDWTAQLKDEVSGVYNDHVRQDGGIDTRTFTYNTGTPIHAYALLYRITGDERYLTEARDLATASLAWFAPERVDGAHAFPDTPWFNSILLRGYVTLLEVDPEPNPTYVDAMLGWLQRGWRTVRDEAGFMPADWGLAAAGSTPRWLLDQTPVIEIAAAGALRDGEASTARR